MASGDALWMILQMDVNLICNLLAFVRGWRLGWCVFNAPRSLHDKISDEGRVPASCADAPVEERDNVDVVFSVEVLGVVASDEAMYCFFDAALIQTANR